MNVICLLGRLTTDPELRRTQTDTAVTSFSVAVDRAFQPKDSEQRQADFINCVAWRQTAEFICRYFHKGQRIALQGSLRMATNARPLRWLSTTLSLLNPKMQAERRPAAPGMIPRFPSTAKRPPSFPSPMRPILRKLSGRMIFRFDVPLHNPARAAKQ